MEDTESLDVGFPKPVLKYFNKILKQTAFTFQPSNSHQVMSASGRSASKAALSSTAASILILEAELEKLQLVTEEFESRLEDIRAYNKYYRSLTSPIRQLPDELLSEIFQYACSERILVADNHAMIWNLMHVCKSWNSLILHTPLFWSRFELDMSGRVAPSATIAMRIHWCLRLSHTMPLEITLASNSSESLTLPRNVYEDMAAEAYRWKFLCIEKDCFYNGIGMPKAMSRMQKCGLAQLRVLEIRGFKGLFPSYMFYSATALEEVCIRSSTFPESPAFPWGNVKKLTVDKLEYRNSRDLLSVFLAMSTSLEELTWADGIQFFHRGVTLEETVTFQNLRKIKLNGEYQLPSFISMLRTPRLSSVHLVGRGVSRDFRPLISMVQASNCSVKKVSIEATYLGRNSAILKVLEELSSIEELSIYEAYKDIVQELVWGAHKLLPSLRRLEFLNGIITATTLDKETIGCIEEIVSSRSLIPTPLAHLKWTSCATKAAYDDHNNAFDDLRKLGREQNVQLDINIRKLSW